LRRDRWSSSTGSLLWLQHSASLEYGLPLLIERPDALVTVLRVDRPIVGLDFEAVAIGPVKILGFVQGTLGLADGDVRIGRDAACRIKHFGHQAVGWHRLVHEAPSEGLLCRKRRGGQNHFLRAPDTDAAGQVLRAHCPWDDAERHL